MTEHSDEAVVRTAATAAEEVIFSRYEQSDIRDIDITVQFEDEQLDIDIYLDAEGNAEQVAEDAMLAARNAVDTLLASG